MGSLLKAQVEHLREAESKLPLRYRYEIDTYIKAIRTEGEAADYIRKVTKAIHDAHEATERKRRTPERKRAAGRKPVIEIAAVADEQAERKQPRSRGRRATKPKKGGGAKRPKK
jgi:hypothetical protein